MKRAGGLWEQVVSFESLHAAAGRALRGKRGRAAAAGFHRELERELLKLEAELRAGTYRPGGFRNFWIQDPKKRLISAAPFRDRVVHHAVVAAIEPLVERRLIDHTYACRQGRGQHRAIDRFRDHVRRYRYVLLLDIEKYFASIDHAVIDGLLRRIIKDRRILDLMGLILENGAGVSYGKPRHYPGDDLFEPFRRPQGLPIGNLTSQLLANLMLDPIDHLATDRLRLSGYLRYMDDFACFSNSRDELQSARVSFQEALWARRLRLNERKSRVRETREVLTFLGFTFSRNGSGMERSGPASVRVRVAPTGVRRWRRRRRALEQAYASGDLTWFEVERSWAGWAAHADSVGAGALAQGARPVPG